MCPDSQRRKQGRRWSLRFRLTVWVVSVFALIQLATGASFWWMRDAEAERLFRQRLLEHAELIAEQLEEQPAHFLGEELDTIAAQGADVIQFPWIEADVIDHTGRSIARPSPRWPDAARRLLEIRAEDSSTLLWTTLHDDANAGNPLAGGEVVAVAVPLASAEYPGALLVVTTTDAFYVRQTDQLKRILLSAGLIGLAASAISGWFIAGIAVAPLHRLSEFAGRLGPETIEEEIDLESESTEVHELTYELEDARSRIQEAFAAQERFLSNISHEIKTPIATLLLAAQTINRSELSAEAQEFVDLANDEMRSLGRLVESFLTLTRVRNGGKPASLKRYLANELVMDAVEACSLFAEEHSVRLHPTLDASEEYLDARVLGDPALLSTMLNNLIRNAVRFSPREESITITALIGDGQFSVSVRDHGPGLPQEIIPDIFDRFVQSKHEANRKRGQGLGLAIAKGIAELHNGDISASNATDGGAVFTVTLPLAGEVSDADPADQSDA